MTDSDSTMTAVRPEEPAVTSASTETPASDVVPAAGETKVESEVKSAPVDPAVAAKVLKQVEFYFGNSNLPKDNHLRGLTQKNEGWVDIAHIASFPKMAALTKDFNAIVSAIRGSKELLEVDPSGTKLRRRAPVPDDLDLNAFSIYAKGFPKEWDLEQIEAFFQPYLEAGEEFRCTRVRRLKDRTPKGSAFIELSSEAAAQRLTKLEVKSPADENTPLIVLMKAEYFKRKQQERGEEKAKRKGPKGEGDNAEAGGKRKRDDGEEKEKREFTRVFNPGCIISVANLPESVDKFKLSDAVASTGAKVAFVDLNPGALSFVRIDRNSEVSGQQAVDKIKASDLKFGDLTPEFNVLEGEAEKAHWEKIWNAQEQHESKGGRGGRGRRGGGRGGGGRGGGGRGGRGGKRQRRDD